MQSPDRASREGEALKITFADDEDFAFSDEEMRLISGIIRQSEKDVRTLLPSLPDAIEVNAVIIDRDIDIVGGITGRANAPGKVQIEFSSKYPGGIREAARSALAGSIFHEFHHLDRGWTIQDNRFGPGIPIAAVNEGLASVFSETYTGVYFEEANRYPAHADEWLAEIMSLPADADYGTWMVQHPDGRLAIGYRIGRYIVHSAIANSGKNILELSRLTPQAILELAAVPAADSTGE
jgi:hypothetical protein